jgi:hypothetical protein
MIIAPTPSRRRGHFCANHVEVVSPTCFSVRKEICASEGIGKSILLRVKRAVGLFKEKVTTNILFSA